MALDYFKADRIINVYFAEESFNAVFEGKTLNDLTAIGTRRKDVTWDSIKNTAMSKDFDKTIEDVSS